MQVPFPLLYIVVTYEIQHTYFKINTYSIGDDRMKTMLLLADDVCLWAIPDTTIEQNEQMNSMSG